MNISRTLSTVAAVCLISFSLGTVASALPPEMTDVDITLAVKSRLAAREILPLYEIDVTTFNGIVTLTGVVPTYAARLDVEDNVSRIRGVVDVVNRLQIRPVARPDAEIRQDIVTALAVDPITEAYKIIVTVEAGIVTLTGRVDSYPEKAVATRLAARVPGVVMVNNRLAPDPTADRPAVEIAEDIRQRLRADASINSGLIAVSVANGNVTLKGSVGSVAEKRKAEYDTWAITGVQSVTNDLNVTWQDRDRMSDWSEAWTDEQIREAVENALLTNPRVRAFNVAATVEDGLVTLSGTVNNLQARQAAEEEVRDTLGVRQVINDLRVQLPALLPDGEVADAVRHSLNANPHVHRDQIAVKVDQGKVLLEGAVDSWYAKEQAEVAAAGVRGVVEIQNDIRVDYAAVVRTDEQIEQNIESQLWWSPFVDSTNIAVDVRSGVATLSGKVEDWNEQRAAERNAREGGAVEVVNRLEIQNQTGRY